MKRHGRQNRWYRTVVLGLLACIGISSIISCELEERTEVATFFFNGFNFSWSNEPHRIGNLGAWLSDIAFDGATETLTADGNLRLKGGDWGPTDSADFRLYYGAVNPELDSVFHKFHHGYTPEMTLEGSIDVGGLSGSTSVALDLLDLGMDHLFKYTVILRGFRFYTTEPEDGYTTSGVGVEIDNIAYDTASEDLSFDVWFKLDAGEVPDRPNQYGPEGDYGYTVRVYYTVIGTTLGAFTEWTDGYTVTYEHCPPAIQPNHLHAYEIDPAVPRVTINGENDVLYSMGFVGWQGFQFTLNDPIPACSSHDGRYMREIMVRNKDFSYDPVSGSADFTMDGYFSNSGGFTYSLRYEFVGHYVLVQLGGEGSVNHYSRSGDMESTSETVSLTKTY